MSWYAARSADPPARLPGGRSPLAAVPPHQHAVAERTDLLPLQGELRETESGLVRRMSQERTGYLAMLELRLEATRRPALQSELTRAVRAEFDENVRFHLDAGLPGDADTVLVLYLAMTGVLLEHFTLPGMLSDVEVDKLVKTVVTRVVPPE